MVQHALEASSGPHSLDEKLIGVSTEAPLASKRQLPVGRYCYNHQDSKLIYPRKFYKYQSGGIFHAYSQGTNGEVHVYRSPPMQEWTKMVVYSGIEEVKRQEDGAPSAYGAGLEHFHAQTIMQLIIDSNLAKATSQPSSH